MDLRSVLRLTLLLPEGGSWGARRPSTRSCPLAKHTVTRAARQGRRLDHPLPLLSEWNMLRASAISLRC